MSLQPSEKQSLELLDAIPAAEVRMIRASLILVVTLVAIACSKKDEAVPARDKPAALTKVSLYTFGLRLDVPGEVDVAAGAGENTVMVTGPEIDTMMVALAKTPESVDDAKRDANAYDPKHVEAESLADGWVLTYDNAAHYYVVVRRDIDGKTYSCTAIGTHPSQAKAVAVACKSLRGK
jgi:hypothetical protein